MSTPVTKEVFDVDVVAKYNKETEESIEPDKNSFYDELSNIFFRDIWDYLRY